MWEVGLWEPRIFLETLPFMMSQWLELAEFIASHMVHASNDEAAASQT
jgi:hypothetical protein